MGRGGEALLVNGMIEVVGGEELQRRMMKPTIQTASRGGIDRY